MAWQAPHFAGQAQNLSRSWRDLSREAGSHEKSQKGEMVSLVLFSEKRLAWSL